MGSRYGVSVATAKPSSFFACSSFTTNPFFRARATVIAGSELLWQETHDRFLKTGSPLVSISGRIFFTAASADAAPSEGLGHSSFTSFAPAFARISIVDAIPIRAASWYAVSPRSFFAFGSTPFESSHCTIRSRVAGASMESTACIRRVKPSRSLDSREAP